MRKIKMHIVQTQHNHGDGTETTFVSIGTDYHSGWGLPMHAQKIISEKTDMIDVFEIGDRVIVELNRGSFQDEDGISSGGKWVKKTGIIDWVNTAANGLSGSIKFDDGDIQSVSLIRGDRGYPGRNIQPAPDKTILPDEVLTDHYYFDDSPDDELPVTQCPEPYRRGIGQGFGSTEDGQEGE